MCRKKANIQEKPCDLKQIVISIWDFSTEHKLKSQAKIVPLIKAEVQLATPDVASFYLSLIPPGAKTEIQQDINQLVHLVLEVSKGVVWQREYSHDASKM